MMKRKVIKLIASGSPTDYVKGYLRQVHIKNSYNMWLLELNDACSNVMLLIDLNVNTDAKELCNLVDNHRIDVITFDHNTSKIVDTDGTCYFDYYSSDRRGTNDFYVISLTLPDHSESSDRRWKKYEIYFNKFEISEEEIPLHHLVTNLPIFQNINRTVVCFNIRNQISAVIHGDNETIKIVINRIQGNSIPSEYLDDLKIDNVFSFSRPKDYNIDFNESFLMCKSINANMKLLGREEELFVHIGRTEILTDSFTIYMVYKKGRDSFCAVAQFSKVEVL